MKQEMIGDVPGNVLGMIADLAHKLQHGKITPAEFGRFLKREDPFIANGGEDELNLSEWHNFYRQVLGREVDLANLHIPEKPEGSNWRALVIPQGVTANELYGACLKRFKCWKYVADLNAITDIVSRPNGAYVIWVKDAREADPDMANISANQVKERGQNTETLKERLIHELKFHDETQGHLDISNWTLCAGSRDPDGDVPNVGWGGDGMGVNWCGPYDRDGVVRARVAIS